MQAAPWSLTKRAAEGLEIHCRAILEIRTAIQRARAREVRAMGSWGWYSKVLFALLVAAFAYWVWPTPYLYLHGLQGIPVRVNRFTGRPHYVLPGK